MLDHMGKSRRQPRVRHGQPGPRRPKPAEPPIPPTRDSQLSPPEVLERIKRAQVTREAAESELAVLVDHAVDLGIGWPEIAAQLGVTRQAARQAYQRRHRNDGSRQIGLPDSSSARMRRVTHQLELVNICCRVPADVGVP